MKRIATFLFALGAEAYEADTLEDGVFDEWAWDFELEESYERGLLSENTTDCNPIPKIDFGELPISCCEAVSDLLGTIAGLRPHIATCLAGAGNCESDGKTPRGAIIGQSTQKMCDANRQCADLAIQGLEDNTADDNVNLKDALTGRTGLVAHWCARPHAACGAFTPEDDHAKVAPWGSANDKYARVSCKPGWTPGQGNDNEEHVLCTPNGWGNDTLACDPRSCGQAPSNLQVTLDCNHGNNMGSTCAASCAAADKYLAQGWGYSCGVKADNSMAWTGAAGCGSTSCTSGSWANSASNDCGVTVADGATCTVTCAEGYDLKGSVECSKGTFSKQAKCMAAGLVVEEVTFVVSALTLAIDISDEDAQSPEFKTMLADSIADSLTGVDASKVEILSVSFESSRRQLLPNGLPREVRRKLATRNLVVDFRVQVEAGSSVESAVMNTLSADQNTFASSFTAALTQAASDAGKSITVSGVIVKQPTKVTEYREVVTTTTSSTTSSTTGSSDDSSSTTSSTTTSTTTSSSSSTDTTTTTTAGVCGLETGLVTALALVTLMW